MSQDANVLKKEFSMSENLEMTTKAIKVLKKKCIILRICDVFTAMCNRFVY